MGVFDTDSQINVDYLIQKGFNREEQSPHDLYTIRMNQNKRRLHFQYYLNHPKKKNMLIANKPVFKGYRMRWKKVAEVRVTDIFDMNIILEEIYNEYI